MCIQDWMNFLCLEMELVFHLFECLERLLCLPFLPFFPQLLEKVY